MRAQSVILSRHSGKRIAGQELRRWFVEIPRGARSE